MDLIEHDINRHEKQLFLEELTSGSGARVHSHAYIVQGIFGVGKSDFAIFCAASILCEGKNPPCFSCRSCKKVFSSTHPDIYFYGAEDKPITMREVRELIDSSALVPNDGDKKIYIIKSAHKMRTDTQNAMLKIFEEPLPSVVIFLLTEKKEALLPTIISRGRQITLVGETDENIRNILNKKHKKTLQEDIDAAVSFAEGSIGRAELFLSKEYRALTDKMIKILECFFEGTKTEFIDAFLGIKLTRENTLALLNLLQRFFLDILKFKLCSTAPIVLKGLAEKYSVKTTKKALVMMSDAINDCRVSLEQSGNLNASITNLCIKLWSFIN